MPSGVRANAPATIRIAPEAITKAKTPKVVAHEVESDPEKLESTKGQLREVWQGIEAGVFPARPGWMCKGCPFQGQCDAAAV